MKKHTQRPATTAGEATHTQHQTMQHDVHESLSPCFHICAIPAFIAIPAPSNDPAYRSRVGLSLHTPVFLSKLILVRQEVIMLFDFFAFLSI
jgi:hypothetical protein